MKSLTRTPQHKKVSFELSGSGGVPITEIGWIHHPRPTPVPPLQTIFDLLLPILRLGDLVSHFRFWQLFDLFCLWN